jgi:hypothetical protein
MRGGETRRGSFWRSRKANETKRRILRVSDRSQHHQRKKVNLHRLGASDIWLNRDDERQDDEKQELCSLDSCEFRLVQAEITNRVLCAHRLSVEPDLDTAPQPVKARDGSGSKNSPRSSGVGMVY